MDAFAQVCERIAASPGRNLKIAILAAYLRTLALDDLGRAARFFAGAPFSSNDSRQLSIGHSTLREAAMIVTGWDKDVLRICHRTVGDTGETLAKLLVGCTENRPLSLERAEL